MKCDLGDLAIFYETYGSGRPIEMLPGRPSDHHIMERFMEPLFTQRDGWLRIYPDWPRTRLCSTRCWRSSTRSSPVNASCSLACPMVGTWPVAWSRAVQHRSMACCSVHPR